MLEFDQTEQLYQQKWKESREIEVLFYYDLSPVHGQYSTLSDSTVWYMTIMGHMHVSMVSTGICTRRYRWTLFSLRSGFSIFRIWYLYLSLLQTPWHIHCNFSSLRLCFAIWWIILQQRFIENFRKTLQFVPFHHDRSITRALELSSPLTVTLG